MKKAAALVATVAFSVFLAACSASGTASGQGAAGQPGGGGSASGSMSGAGAGSGSMSGSGTGSLQRDQMNR